MSEDRPYYGPERRNDSPPDADGTGVLILNHNGHVWIQFSHATHLLGMAPELAEQIAEALLIHAADARGALKRHEKEAPDDPETR